MAFLDVLGKKLSQTGQDVVRITKDTAEVIKYNTMISSEEHNMEAIYAQIGKLYVERFEASGEEVFADLIADLKKSQEKIAEYRRHIVQVKGVFPCPNCGEELPLNTAFCSVCGTKIEKKADAAPTNINVRHCQSCGAPLEDGYVFCINCGAKDDVPVTEAASESLVEEAVPEKAAEQ